MGLPPKPPPAPPPKTQGGNGTTKPATRVMGVQRGIQNGAQRITIYGGGGIGKSSLAALLTKVGCDPLFIDVESGSHFLDVARLTPETHDELRAALQDFSTIDQFGAVVLDSATKAEELATLWTLDHVPLDSQKDGITRYPKNVEGYGWGKGYSYVMETFLQILCDLDAIVRRGKHVILICHDCTVNATNPDGNDFYRYEPRLQSPPGGKGSLRHRVKEWSDHLFFIGYDVSATKDGKATGTGSRAIYTTEKPTCWAKNRMIPSLPSPIVYKDGDAALWQLLLHKE